ncbi:Bipolar kinesin KRP-130 [Papilio machaon]|uniref:Bipolar kinesin KRP-130 n=1 Tax=Papilio machaon TaxID=76193 RepID=A0A194RD02_PAPMA|nr:Bipolar kinesin KRP-130 [Papilio machaon]
METKEMIASNQQVSEQVCHNVELVIQTAALNCNQALTSMLEHVNSNTSLTIEEVSNVCTSSAALEKSSNSHQTAQSERLSAAQREAENFYSALREEMTRQEEVEEKCLKEEYKVYSPTGRTPARAQYNYPRTLPATSPHQKLLAPFPATQ